MSRCGSLVGAAAHARKGETPCDACALATTKNRLHAKAQMRAQRRLAATYPEEYRALYQEEKAQVFSEAGFRLRPGPPVWSFE